MRITRFAQPSTKQVEASGGDEAAARKRMLDWHVIQEKFDGVRVALGDFALVPGKPWQYPAVAKERGLPEDTPLNGGEVGATTVATALQSEEVLSQRGSKLISTLSRWLLRSCIAGDPRVLSNFPPEARKQVKADRQYGPTGYPAIVDIRIEGQDAIVEVTQIGDAYVALETEGRIAYLYENNRLPIRRYDGEIIAGKEKKIDLFKFELLAKAQELYPNVHKQFFYDLIFNGANRPEFFPKNINDLEEFKKLVICKLCTYACAKHRGLKPELFYAMIAESIEPWQQQVAQNNPKAGPFWYPALDPVGDTPEDGILFYRFKLRDVFTPPHPSILLWTDGSKPAKKSGITIHDLEGVNAYGERTELEVVFTPGPLTTVEKST